LYVLVKLGDVEIADTFTVVSAIERSANVAFDDKLEVVLSTVFRLVFDSFFGFFKSFLVFNLNLSK
jgi:hypothetical protein